MKENLNPDSFSYRLRQLRKKQNLTQQGLANKLNVHVTTVKNWENCYCLPDIDNICIVAENKRKADEPFETTHLLFSCFFTCCREFAPCSP